MPRAGERHTFGLHGLLQGTVKRERGACPCDLRAFLSGPENEAGRDDNEHDEERDELFGCGHSCDPFSAASRASASTLLSPGWRVTKPWR